MSLLREIQDAAISANTPLTVVLRKCKVLAARLGSDELKLWVDFELTGYKNIEELPEYRILKVSSKGHFAGPFNSGLRNADIPLSCVPKKFRGSLSKSHMMEPIASLESLIEGSEKGSAMEPWNSDFIAHFGQDMYEGMNCIQAWKVIPINSIVGALDAVRNRILNFVLEIEAEAPDAGEAAINSKPIPKEKTSQIFNTYITGNVHNVATGSKEVTQTTTVTNDNGMFNELLHVLMQTDQRSIATKQLLDSVEEMKASQGTVKFKEHYQSFMGILADHMQVYGPVVAPFLPSLAALVP